MLRKIATPSAKARNPGASRLNAAASAFVSACATFLSWHRRRSTFFTAPIVASDLWSPHLTRSTLFSRWPISDNNHVAEDPAGDGIFVIDPYSFCWCDAEAVGPSPRDFEYLFQDCAPSPHKTTLGPSQLSRCGATSSKLSGLVAAPLITTCFGRHAYALLPVARSTMSNKRPACSFVCSSFRAVMEMRACLSLSLFSI